MFIISPSMKCHPLAKYPLNQYFFTWMLDAFCLLECFKLDRTVWLFCYCEIWTCRLKLCSAFFKYFYQEQLKSLLPLRQDLYYCQMCAIQQSSKERLRWRSLFHDVEKHHTVWASCSNKLAFSLISAIWRILYAILIFLFCIHHMDQRNKDNGSFLDWIFNDQLDIQSNDCHQVYHSKLRVKNLIFHI